MCPVLIEYQGEVVQNYTLDLLDPARRLKWEQAGYKFSSGWQMCNLSSVNCAGLDSPGELLRYTRLATVLGTYQASLTSLPYLGDVSERIVRREALLGVSMTGVYSNRAFLSPELLNLAAETAERTNRYHAMELGIAPASRICCIKPEGTASLTLGVVSPGAHPYHAKEYIRRVQATEDEPLYQHVLSEHPSACASSVWGASNLKVISFACTAPESAITRDSLSLEQHVADIITLNKEWVRVGEGKVNRCEGAHHNVSVTFSVRDDEWDALPELLWEGRQYLTGVSMLSAAGDYVYEQAPLQQLYRDSTDIKHIEAVQHWDHVSSLGELDFSNVVEEQDSTEVQGESACSGGACLLPMWDNKPSMSDEGRAAIALIIELAQPLLRETPEVYEELSTMLRKWI